MNSTNNHRVYASPPRLLMRDALAILDLDVNTRVFFDQSELDVVTTLLREARRDNPALAATFEVEVNDSLLVSPYPVRRQIVQYNEGTGAFIRRLLRRRGITWFFRPGRAADSRAPEASGHAPPTPAHTMVLLRSARRFQLSRAGTIRFHRDSATEERDSITAFGAVRALRPSRVGRHSWDYGNPQGTFFMSSHADSTARQGVKGDKLAATLEHYQVEAPHVRDDHDELAALVRQALARSNFEAKCYHAEGGVRNCTAGEYFILSGHPAIDRHPLAEREFIVLSSHITAQNNLPKDYNARVARLFARNRWQLDDANLPLAGENWFDAGQLRYLWRATCVRRDIAFVPAWDARVDTPQAQLQSAVVVGAPGEAVHCDVQGRVKVRFTAMRERDHAHADGAGASDTDSDSAWVRVATGWAGMGGSRHFGSVMLPRPGTEVLIGFLGGDPDKPVIIGQLYNAVAHPPYLGAGDLPGNKYLSGIKSREIKGSRANQLRFDDSTGQINAQLASEDGRSELNLGWLTQPRRNGAGAPRGEGAELTTDAQLALRAGRGMLLSAWSRLAGGGKQLDRADYLALMEDCLELFRSLGQFAAQNQALPIEDKAQGEVQAAIKQWDNGSNTAPSGAGGGAAAIGLTAPAGISFASAKTIVSYAAVNIDSVAQQHLQLTAGQRFNVNAGKGISLFSHHDGIAAIAHHGKLLLQSQHDDTEINAAKNCKITATEGKVTVMATVLEFVTEDGSFIRLGDGDFVLGSKTPLKFRAPAFDFDGPATLAAALPTFGSAGVDQKFVLRYGAEDSGAIAADRHFEIEMTDGSTLKGISDAAGHTSLLQRDAMHIARVRIINDKQ